ncbi:hypothetical protein ACFVT1_21335 [Streptomyces sp. NPDC057963]|uniref:hypothetical protein n=1 Tax=Streptomyces sp. NPDC057963 TaxID=3346290 RepID=UPI0036EFDB00
MPTSPRSRTPREEGPASAARVRDVQTERIRDAYEKAYAQESAARIEERANADF